MEEATSRRERKKQDMKNSIFKKAIYLFRTKGFDETNVEEITEALDISRATFFNYFSSKDKILHELAQRTVQLYKDLLEEKLLSDMTTEEALSSVMEQVVGNLKEYRSLFRDVFLEMMRSQIGFFEESKAEQSTINDIMAKVIRRGQERGELRNENPHLLAEMLAGISTNILLNWFHTQESYSVEDRLKRAIHVFSKGAELRMEEDSAQQITPRI